MQNPKPATKAEKKKKKEKAKEKKAGGQDFISQMEQPPKLEVVKRLSMMPKAAQKYVMGMKESWHLQLLSHLYNPSLTYRPPSPAFAGLAFDGQQDFQVYFEPNTYDPITGKTELPTGLRVDDPAIATFARNNDTTGLGGSAARMLNYTTFTGKIKASIPLKVETGGIDYTSVGIMLWVDPYDMTRPLRWSIGDVNSSWWRCGVQYDVADYPDARAWTSNTNSVTGYAGWTQTPYFLPTNYVQSSEAVLYPDGYQVNTTADVADKVYVTNGVSYLCYPLSVVANARVPNSTAYSQTGMRTRTLGNTNHRILTRIEDPNTGYYGNSAAFIRSNGANLAWSGDKWALPRRGAVPAQFLEPVTGDYVSTTNPNLNNRYNWWSLQSMLQEGFPVLEVINNNAGSDSATPVLDVYVDVEMAISPLYLADGLGNKLTCPLEIPTWFSVAKGEGKVLGNKEDVMGDGRNTALTSTGSGLARPKAALENHPGTTPVVKALQSKITQPGALKGALDTVQSSVQKAGEGLLGNVLEGAKSLLPEILGGLAFL